MSSAHVECLQRYYAHTKPELVVEICEKLDVDYDGDPRKLPGNAVYAVADEFDAGESTNKSGTRRRIRLSHPRLGDAEERGGSQFYRSELREIVATLDRGEVPGDGFGVPLDGWD
jgi:hypothetical protein